MFLPLKFRDVLLGQPYLWKIHVVHESKPHTIVINLGKNIYMMLVVAPPISIYLISTKQCNKIISQTVKFVFFPSHFQRKGKIMVTFMGSIKGSFSW